MCLFICVFDVDNNLCMPVHGAIYAWLVIHIPQFLWISDKQTLLQLNNNVGFLGSKIYFCGWYI